MPENLDEKKSADGQSTSADAVTPEGGAAKQSDTGADLNKNVDPKAEEVKDGVTKVTKKVVEEKDEDDDKKKDSDEEEMEEGVEISNDFNAIFEEMDLSEDFKKKASLVFEAAVNEAAAEKASAITEEIEKNLQEEFDTAITESIDEIVENLDGYLDYIVKEWVEENEVAIDSGIKVEMAESLMDGLKELFYEHNMEIDEDTIDIVSGLEEELEETKKATNTAITNNIALKEELQSLRAEKVFSEMTEGLSVAQEERFRVLSEKLDNSDLDEYRSDLGTLKESFFKTKQTVISEDLDKEGEEILVEEETKTKPSAYDSVNAYAKALATFK